ncbi:uncharacterized protein N7496_007404 [Penicillium cataractarum]|uniref:Uncharacterized protein n=1 Tax=Penicillium cataractarum TaxID=2100454 RepID=A0A9W9S451_9EURO|nr:uncharacterized protein N7496_007404 [Penicillium cataractarum]KAJ5371312.1 hypothetical protein N7496_007404 [Penicillium cataractarum]
MPSVTDAVHEAYNAGIFEGNRHSLYRDIFKWSQELRRGDRVHMNIAAKLDDFAEGWRTGQLEEIKRMNPESKMDARNNTCQKVGRLCDAMNRVADILRRQLAIEVDVADLLVAISVHVGRCRYFCSSTSVPDPYADGLDVFAKKEHELWWKTHRSRFVREISTSLMESMNCRCYRCVFTN